MNGKKRIPVEKAVLNLLREYGITIEDLFDAMRVEGIDVYSELLKRVYPRSRDVETYIYSLPWRLASITLFTIQALYIVNPAGIYKGFLLDPPRESLVIGDKVKYNALIYLINRLKTLI